MEPAYDKLGNARELINEYSNGIIYNIYNIMSGSTISSSQSLTQSQADTSGWPITIAADVTVTLSGSFTLDATDEYFIIGGADAVLDGDDNTVTVTVADYPGLVKNGSLSANGFNCTVKNVIVAASGSGTLVTSGGWIGQQYFSCYGTSTITRCSSTGEMSNNQSGGITGQESALNSGNLTITKCFSTGANSGSNGGGIGGKWCGKGGTLTITNCYSTGAISGYNSGVYLDMEQEQAAGL